MSVLFELWDIESGNLIGAYDSQEAALTIVRDANTRHGASYVRGLLLSRENSRGRSRTIAMGDALLELAEVAGPVHAPIAAIEDQ